MILMETEQPIPPPTLCEAIVHQDSFQQLWNPNNVPQLVFTVISGIENYYNYNTIGHIMLAVDYWEEKSLVITQK